MYTRTVVEEDEEDWKRVFSLYCSPAGSWDQDYINMYRVGAKGGKRQGFEE